MPEIEPRVDEEKLRLLLAEGHESASLDYKASCDLGDIRALVATTKDIGAMCGVGGYIVVGADDNGRPTGLVSPRDVQLFDQANLQAKLRKYLDASVEVRSAAHEIDGSTLIVVYVAPHPDGFAVFTANGTYKDGRGRDQFEFREGEVFVRHGSASERWTQADISRVRDGLRARERERWRREFSEDMAGTFSNAEATQNLAAAPAAALDWRLDEETLTSAVIEQIRRDDPIPLELLLTRMPGDARAAVNDQDRERLELILDRIAAITATLLLVGRRDLLDRAIATMVAIYDAGDEARDHPRSATSLTPEAIWLAAAERVFAVGALAVRRGDWPAVRALVLQTGHGPDFPDAYYRSWLRHAITTASRARLLGTEPGQRGDSVSMLNLALQHIDRLPALRPDRPAGDEELLSSLCQFDMLAYLTVLGDGAPMRAYYPSFARFYSRRSDPAVVTVLSQPDARTAIFPGSDDELAHALREIAQSASGQAFYFDGWDGYSDRRIEQFLAAHPAAEA